MSEREVSARNGLEILASLRFEEARDETGGAARETAAANAREVANERASNVCPSGEIDETWFVSPAGLPLLTEKQRAAARTVSAEHRTRYHLNKNHADRGKQFKPFAALRGYEQLVEREIERANRQRDFTKPEESC